MICLMVVMRRAKVTAIPQMKPRSPGAEQRLSCMGQNTQENTFTIEGHCVPRPPWSSCILEKSARALTLVPQSHMGFLILHEYLSHS